MTSPTPRTSDQKAGPCGAVGSSPGAVVGTFSPGQTITVTWDETVDHPGHYRIALDPDGGDDFQNPYQPDDAFPEILVDQIPDRVGGGAYSQEVTLPDIECARCTLQLMQIMTTSVPYDSFYFQCADIEITSGGAGGGDAGDGGGGDASGGCQVSGSSGLGGALALLMAALLAFRRRR